jgi:membrane dipeptidase
MSTRRDVLKAGAGLALAALAPRTVAATGGAQWPPYPDALPIDGAGGLGLFWIDDDDASAIAAELAAARASGLAAVVQTVAPSGKFWLDDAAYAKIRDTLTRWREIADRHADALLIVERGEDLYHAKRQGKLGMVFTSQGTEPLGEDLERIPQLHGLGLRVMQLTHNRRNLVGDGCMEPGNAGLSNYGRQVVERLNAEKFVVDLAHGSQRTMAEGIRASKTPVLISHTGCRALADLPRNTGDAELRALAERGGVAGMISWPYLRTDSQPMAADLVRHIEHAVNVCGEDHVGLGTDGGVAPIERTADFERDNREWIRGAKADGVFGAHRPDALYTFIPDLNSADRFDTLAAMLSARGHSDARIGKILGGNFARVFREVWG